MNEVAEWILAHRLGDGKYKTTILESPFAGRPSLRLTAYDALPPEEWERSIGAHAWHHVVIGDDITGGAPVEFWYEFAGNVDRLTIAYWNGMIDVDPAYPQSWAEEYNREHGKWPDAMWKYRWLTDEGEKKLLHGEPVLMRDFLAAIELAIYFQLRREEKL